MNREWLYVPNIIGYVRVCLLILFFISNSPFEKSLLMATNLILDVFDGKIARLLNQSSLFGARFDLIIDMLSLTLLSFYVAFLAQNLWISCLFIFCGINDFISYTLSIVIFYGKKSDKMKNHKEAIGAKGYLLPVYYSVFGLAIANVLHDAYLLSYVYCPSFIPSFVVYLCLSVFLFRQCCVAEQTYHLFRFRSILRSF